MNGKIYDSGSGGGAGSDTTAIHSDTAGEIAAIDQNTTPVGSDKILTEDSADSNNKKHVRADDLVRLAGAAFAVYAYEIPDDGVWAYEFPEHVQGTVMISTNNSAWYCWAFIRTTSAAFCTIASAHAIFEATTGALTAGSGNDGKITISAHTDKKFYVSNRSGANGYLRICFMVPTVAYPSD